MLSSPSKYPRATAFLLILLALLLMIPEIFFWVRSCFRSHKEGKREKKEKDGAGGEE